MEEEEAVTIHLPLNPIRPAAQRVRQVLVTRVALTSGRITEEDTSQTLMGVQLCFSFHTKRCDPSSCPRARAHQCQLCLGFHQNSQCSTAKRNGKGGGKP